MTNDRKRGMEGAEGNYRFGPNSKNTTHETKYLNNQNIPKHTTYTIPFTYNYHHGHSKGCCQAMQQHHYFTAVQVIHRSQHVMSTRHIASRCLAKFSIAARMAWWIPLRELRNQSPMPWTFTASLCFARMRGNLRFQQFTVTTNSGENQLSLTLFGTYCILEVPQCKTSRYRHDMSDQI